VDLVSHHLLGFRVEAVEYVFQRPSAPAALARALYPFSF